MRFRLKNKAASAPSFSEAMERITGPSLLEIHERSHSSARNVGRGFPLLWSPGGTFPTWAQ